MYTFNVYRDYRYAGDGLDYVFTMTVYAATQDDAAARIRNMVGQGFAVLPA